jgi:hypothetical protein
MRGAWRALVILSLLAASGCYKCYTTSECSDAFTRQVNDVINNNPSIIDYANRNSLCLSASSSSSNPAWSNKAGCSVVWQVATN